VSLRSRFLGHSRHVRNFRRPETLHSRTRYLAFEFGLARLELSPVCWVWWCAPQRCLQPVDPLPQGEPCCLQPVGPSWQGEPCCLLPAGLSLQGGLHCRNRDRRAALLAGCLRTACLSPHYFHCVLRRRWTGPSNWMRCPRPPIGERAVAWVDSANSQLDFDCCSHYEGFDCC